jgi:hypothetical protein
MWLLSQYFSQHCGVYTYILATVELSLLSKTDNRHRPFCSQLLLFLVHNYLPLAHNLNKGHVTVQKEHQKGKMKNDMKALKFA